MCDGDLVNNNHRDATSKVRQWQASKYYVPIYSSEKLFKQIITWKTWLVLNTILVISYFRKYFKNKMFICIIIELNCLSVGIYIVKRSNNIKCSTAKYIK